MASDYSSPRSSGSGPFQLYLRVPGEKGRPPRGLDAVIPLEGSRCPGQPLFHNFPQLFALPPERAEAVLGFLFLALGVWAADKLVRRAGQPDAWSRCLTLHLPAPPSWAGLAPRLAGLAAILTGDSWSITLRGTALKPLFTGHWPHSWQPTGVVLFSGGLDSLTGALDLLEAGHRLVLVSHYDYGQLAATQQGLAAALRRHYGPDRFHHLAIRVQFEGPELTLRSRSLLYLALGLAAAAAFPGPPPLLIPENGWISLNPPLTLNRLGTLSTRTTHPQILEEVAALWREAGLDQGLHNPYQEFTKGEMLAQCRAPGLLKELAPRTISCARPVAGRWRREAPGACGYCYPCLVRRAALHRLGADRGSDYRVDVGSSPEILRRRVQGVDLRGLLWAVKTWEHNPEAVMARLWLGKAPGEISRGAARARRLLAAGFAELADWLMAAGGSWLQDFLAERGAEAGLAPTQDLPG